MKDTETNELKTLGHVLDRALMDATNKSPLAACQEAAQAVIAAYEERTGVMAALRYLLIAIDMRTEMSSDAVVLPEIQKEYGGAIAAGWKKARAAIMKAEALKGDPSK